ncbi:hypothetical protein IAG44_18700 [Streptomyces roseirectus]|uniref:Uncharacterized protein n=1 Tax=Streptomyces roseirectus TaxID=2768066 RepID=A0A7H0IEQ2_9ACTN|nr:hypothetical protein [Streptomyces roseirectus]QNP71268.1 hypothetical protein IAG44_18700 [Streptomyces roseirectus]
MSVEDRQAFERVLRALRGGERFGTIVVSSRFSYSYVQFADDLYVGLSWVTPKVLVLNGIYLEVDNRDFRQVRRHQLAMRLKGAKAPDATAARTTSIAARIAGRNRAHLGPDWAAVLAGAPEHNVTFSARRQCLLAVGFLFAALRMRVHDVARPAWRPVDWLLSASSRTNALITGVVGAQAIYIVDDGGLPALVTEVWEPCGILGTALFVLARWIRRLRGIELAVPEGERAD